MIEERAIPALVIPFEVVSVGEDNEPPEGVVKKHVEYVLKVSKTGAGVV